jgi:hypothetical protein
MAVIIPLYISPYRHEQRPTLPESLGEHSDREFAKVEVTIATLTASFTDRLTKLEARLTAAGIP